MAPSSSATKVCHICNAKATRGFSCLGPCKQWYHVKCAGLKKREEEVCKTCNDIYINVNKCKQSDVNKTKDDVNIHKETDDSVILCPACSTTADRGGDVVGCDGVCGKWFHVTCLSEGDQAVGDGYWYCSSCYGKEAFPGFPSFVKTADPTPATWGLLKGPFIKETFGNAYDEIIKWKKNLFKVPSGAQGKAYVKATSKVINYYVNNSPLQNVAMTALMVMPALLLQKPSKRSKTKDHVRHLEDRLKLWEKGDIKGLIKEGKAIQKRITSSKFTPQHTHKVFSKLMLQGKVSAALRWVTNKAGGLLEPTPETIKLLESKHPDPQPEESFLVSSLLSKVGLEKVDNVIFENIDIEAIQKAAKNTNGSAGPSGLDSDGWQRILCSKSFKTCGAELCESVALLTRKLCTELVDPDPLASFISCRLIPLDKNPGVRPIGIGEVLRRIIGKSVTTLLKPEILAATAPLQASAGLEGGVEAAIHALRTMYEDEDTHGILLVDADNAFNRLNRRVALHNTSVMCPELYKYLVNTYRKAAKLYIPNSKGLFILSQEGTTQGDNCASAFYSCSLMPLLDKLPTEPPDISPVVCENTKPPQKPPEENNKIETPPDTTPDRTPEVNKPSNKAAKHIWFADDSGAAGRLKALKIWWDTLQASGPVYGYFPKPSKTWLIVKEEYQEEAKSLFPDLNITTEGCRYLGSFIGTESGKTTFIQAKCVEWIEEIKGLASIAQHEPHLAYAAFVYGSSRRWSFLMRTTPDIAVNLQPIEDKIRNLLIPNMTGHTIRSNLERSLFSLPAKLGGLAIINPVEIADNEYKNSLMANQQLTEHILKQHTTLNTNREAGKAVKSAISLSNAKRYESLKNQLMNDLPPSISEKIPHACEKGASSWLTGLPYEKYGFVLNKRGFKDAIALRYALPIANIAKKCICGKDNTYNHILICKKGGFVNSRHNRLRDTVASILEKICNEVVVEPTLQPCTGESLRPGTILDDGARLDIAARGLWSPMEMAFFDIRVLHPGAKSNANHNTPAKMYSKHEREKERKYGDRCVQIEKGTCNGLVFSTTGGMGPQATMFLKRVATLLAAKTSQDKSLIMANLRRRLRFELLKTVLIAVRGHRGRYYEKAIPVDELDLNLAHTTNDEDRGDDVDDEDDEVDDEVENVEEEVPEE